MTHKHVEAPIVLIDKINSKLEKILKTTKYNNEKIVLHLHPFIASSKKKRFFK